MARPTPVRRALHRALLTPGRDLASPETRPLLAPWVRLHGVRTVRSCAACVGFVYLAVNS